MSYELGIFIPLAQRCGFWSMQKQGDKNVTLLVQPLIFFLVSSAPSQPDLHLLWNWWTELDTGESNWVVTVEKPFPSYWRCKNCTLCLPEDLYLGKATGNKFQSELWSKGGWNAQSLVKGGLEASCPHHPRLLLVAEQKPKTSGFCFVWGFLRFPVVLWAGFSLKICIS